MTEPYFNISNVTDLPFDFLTTDLPADVYENSTIWNEDMERFVSISVFILFSFIFFFGLVGNGLVVIGEFNQSSRLLTSCYWLLSVVAVNPLMRSTTNILIINLAVADLLFVIFCKRINPTSWMTISAHEKCSFQASPSPPPTTSSTLGHSVTSCVALWVNYKFLLLPLFFCALIFNPFSSSRFNIW